jgi:uroporphyrinogen decarboxylase
MTKKENIIRTIKRDNPLWVPYRYDGSLTFLLPDIVTQRSDGGLDDWGTNWVEAEGLEGEFTDEKPVVLIDEVADFKVPETDFQYITEDLRIKLKKCSEKDTLCIVKNELALFSRAQLLFGTEMFLIEIMMNQDKVELLLEKILEYQIELTEAIMKSGVPGVRFTDDWGMQNTMLIHPDIWRRLIKPRLKEMYDVVKKYNGFVFQHSCGHIEEIVLDLIEIDVDVLDPCQPAANNIFKWKEMYGDRLSFMGGLDTQGFLSFGSPQEVKSKAEEVINRMSVNGGYIAAPSHTISFPEANKQALLDALEEINLKEMPL